MAVFLVHSEDHSVLCRFADTAMYFAKEVQNTYLIFDENIKELKNRHTAAVVA